MQLARARRRRIVLGALFGVAVLALAGWLVWRAVTDDPPVPTPLPVPPSLTPITPDAGTPGAGTPTPTPPSGDSSPSAPGTGSPT